MPLILGLLAVPAFAHHTFSVEYDARQCSSMTGTLTKVDWENPASSISMWTSKMLINQVDSWSFFGGKYL